MSVHDTGYDLLSPDYIRNTEGILKDLVRSEHRIVTARLREKPVYIVADMQLAKQVYEDGWNFSFAPMAVEDEHAITEGARAFAEQGLESSLLKVDYNDYKATRKLFNQAFKHGYTDCADELDRRAKQHLNDLLDRIEPPTLDAVDLCRQYWLPLVASTIGLESLSFAELAQMADCSRTLVEANGMQGDRAAMERLAAANATVLELIRGVAISGAAPKQSALGYLLTQLEPEPAIDMARSFVLGGIDTGSSALALFVHLLAGDAPQRTRFLAMTQDQQQAAVTELASKETPALYSPRFAVRDVKLDDVDIPAGSFLQLALYGLNNCANPDFDVRRSDKSACPMHNNESLPFGHARHHCPGEMLARHLMPIFLNGLFGRFDVTAIQSCRREANTFARSINELILNVENR